MIEAMMMAAGSKNNVPDTPGTPWEGGYFVRRMLDTDLTTEYALVVSTKADGGPGSTMTWQNAMDFAAGMTAGGYTDWKLPDLDEMRILYREFKPTTQANNINFGATDRVAPPLGNYTSGDPSQTSLAEFQGGGGEAFVATNYWTATEYSSSGAWYVVFNNGYETNYSKAYSYYVRAVRRVYF